MATLNKLSDYTSNATNKQQNVKEINDIETLERVMTGISNAKDDDAVLAYCAKAQLRVITILNTPSEITLTFVDTLVEQLHKAVHVANGDECQVKEIQQRGSIMLVNMVFFIEAKLKYEEDKKSKDGYNLLAEGCNLLAESVASIIPQTRFAVVVKNLANSMFEEQTKKDKKGNFISRFFEWAEKDDIIAEQKEEFEQFLNGLTKKIDEHYDIFGRSIQLSGFLQNNKKRILGWRLRGLEPPKPPTGKGRSSFPPKVFMGIAGASVVVGIAIVIYGLGFDPDLDGNMYSLCITGGILLPVFANALCWPTIVGIRNAIKEQELYNDALLAYNTIKGMYEDFYDVVADKVSINGGWGESYFDQTVVDTSTRALEEYETYCLKRMGDKW